MKYPETEMRPTVGRIVHYQSYGTPGGEFLPEARAAIIASVEAFEPENGMVSIVVFNPTGLFFNTVGYAETPTPGCWNWPPRV